MMNSHPDVRRCRRSSGRQKVLLGLMVFVLVLGVGIIGVAANLAHNVEAFRQTRTATYWAGVICVSLFVLYLPTHFVSVHKPGENSTKWMIVLWVSLASFAAICIVFASMIAIYYTSLIAATDQNNCVYFNSTGIGKGPSVCKSQCLNKFNLEAPKKICCCCRPESSDSKYSGIYVTGIDNCSDLFGLVRRSVVALSAINGVTAVFLILASIMGCALCCGCCKVEAQWTPQTTNIVLVPVDPTSRDKAPLLTSEVVGIDVPPPYSAN